MCCLVGFGYGSYLFWILTFILWVYGTLIFLVEFAFCGFAWILDVCDWCLVSLRFWVYGLMTLLCVPLGFGLCLAWVWVVLVCCLWVAVD